MTILQKIISHKQKELQQIKELKPVKLLEKSIYFETEVVSMRKYLQRTDKVGIIAEIKRSSPSTGPLKVQVDVEQLSIGYMQAGATALSVLTDSHFFDGKNDDLTIARKFNYCPILRKDFITDEYQVIEAKSIGADCILLIAACLDAAECKRLAGFAKRLGLEVLLEVHNQHELENYLSESIDIVGVNNRNLNDFTTDIATSMNLAKHIPDEFVKISESGISKAEEVHILRHHGFQGFLIGGYFMKQSRPETACRNLIKEIEKVPV